MVKRKPLDKSGWDKEMIPLCDALNSIPGVFTTESCSGHGKRVAKVWISINYIEDLNSFLWAGCHRWWNWGYPWEVHVNSADPERYSNIIKIMLHTTHKEVYLKDIKEFTTAILSYLAYLEESK